MSKDKKLLVFLVDDDEVYLQMLAMEFQAVTNYQLLCFPTGEACIQAMHRKPDFIILDYMLSGIHPEAMDGINALDQIKAVSPETPVIMLSVQDKMEIAVASIQHKAYDYV